MDKFHPPQADKEKIKRQESPLRLGSLASLREIKFFVIAAKNYERKMLIYFSHPIAIGFISP